MSEAKRILDLLDELYNGKPWIDVNIIDNLKPLKATTAAKKIGADWNSIWQIVNHLLGWRNHIMQNLDGGKLTSPSHNYFHPVEDTSEAAWQATLQSFAGSQQAWQAYLQELPDDELYKTMEGHKYNNYQYIQGILQHDAYHLGQIAMLAKHGK
ncbi:MAG: DinB family protein [Ferruginibacter sp.]